MSSNTVEMLIRAGLLALAGLASAAACEARDRPGTPTAVQARAASPTALAISWRNTARDDELIRYEVDFTKNGTPEPVRQPGGTSGEGPAWSAGGGMTVLDLEPEARYCFRVWSRFVDGGVRSAQPSAWACADLPAVPPLEPLDVAAQFSLDGKLAYLQWSAPDQSRHRRISKFEIERQSPPGPNRPVLQEGSVAGPDGAQSIKTKLSFTFKSSELNPALQHAFRVCAVNSGGRTCAKAVVPTAAAINVHKTGRERLVPQPRAERQLTARDASALPAAPQTPLKVATLDPTPGPSTATLRAASASASAPPLWKTVPVEPPRPPVPMGSVLRTDAVPTRPMAPAAPPPSSLPRQGLAPP